MNQTEFPRLRERPRVTSSGKQVVYFFWDGRGRGMAEVPLGTDRELAVQRWRECERGIFPSGGKYRAVIKVRRAAGRRTFSAEEWIAAEPFFRLMYFNAERRAASAKRPFTLKPAEFLRLVEMAGGKCQVSGIPFGPAGSAFAPSLDRIDCAKGYEPGNVRLVCHIANVAMNTWGIEPLLRLSEALLRKPID